MTNVARTVGPGDATRHTKDLPMFAKAPTLAWLLVALTCFMVGAYVGEVRRQADPPLAFPTIGVAVAVEVGFAPTSTPSPTPIPPFTPTPSPALDPDGEFLYPNPTTTGGTGKPRAH